MQQAEYNEIIWPMCMLSHLCRRECRARASVTPDVPEDGENRTFIHVQFGGCVKFDRRKEVGE